MSTQRKRPTGRGTGDNPPNRYHTFSATPFDDGWPPTQSAPSRTRVERDHSRKAISYNDSPDIPFDRSVNPYRGCEHGCIYCYARPTHTWLDLSPGLDFESRLLARPVLPQLLREELSSAGYTPTPLAIGGITDGYQPIEREYRITRGVIEVLAETQHPTLLITKSAMIERDIDLLSHMATNKLVEVSVSLTTLDRRLICFDLSMVRFSFLSIKHLGSGPIRQTATVDHADIRGLVTTGLHCVAELAFL